MSPGEPRPGALRVLASGLAPLILVGLMAWWFLSYGIAYVRLGEKRKAKAAFQKVVEQNPGTAYEERAKKELAALDAK